MFVASKNLNRPLYLEKKDAKILDSYSSHIFLVKIIFIIAFLTLIQIKE
jgi:hypothetical protein